MARDGYHLVKLDNEIIIILLLKFDLRNYNIVLIQNVFRFCNKICWILNLYTLPGIVFRICFSALPVKIIIFGLLNIR